jgi:osmoprotectant transport system substrate-binding protein
MTFKRSLAAAGLGATLLMLAACGGGGGSANPLGNASSSSSGSSAGGGSIVVGSAAFSESTIIAELYSQAMKAKGVNSSTKLNIGSREVYLRALQQKDVSMVPEYTGNLLINYDKNATATTASEVEAALPKALPSGLQVLKSSPAADQDVYVVTKDYAAQNGIASLADLKKVAGNVTLGGPSELETRAYGPQGLEKEYGVKVKAFKPYDSPAVKAKDLNDGKLQVATFFTTESVISKNGYVELKDPQSMILPNNVVPLVSTDVASNATAKSAIEAVQSALTTEDLISLDAKVDEQHEEAPQVAADWLKSKGLV